jgi:nicotinate-nucleotide--dimethylbenzimidazole phosphoribosyltransferase
MAARLDTVLKSIKPTDAALIQPAKARLDDLTKPQGSLGRLEELAVQLYRIQQTHAEHPSQGNTARLDIDPARIYTVAGDHGVAASGVSLYPQEVTRQMVLNLAAGGAAVNVLGRTAGVDVRVVDAGSAGGEYPSSDALIQRKIAPGTCNIEHGPAMRVEQCVQALELGLELAEQAADEGCKVVGLGDMGIANTTPSAALYCAYFDRQPIELAGPGTGLSSEGVARKAEVIGRALAANADAVKSKDPLRILAALGGYEIATLAGITLGGAARGLAVAIDGYISTAAYAAAWRLNPAVADYAVFCHASAEPGHRVALQAMRAAPLLDLGMRLGEGTGAALAIFLMRAAANVFNEMATFSGAAVSKAKA